MNLRTARARAHLVNAGIFNYDRVTELISFRNTAAKGNRSRPFGFQYLWGATDHWQTGPHMLKEWAAPGQRGRDRWRREFAARRPSLGGSIDPTSRRNRLRNGQDCWVTTCHSVQHGNRDYCGQVPRMALLQASDSVSILRLYQCRLCFTQPVSPSSSFTLHNSMCDQITSQSSSVIVVGG